MPECYNEFMTIRSRIIEMAIPGKKRARLLSALILLVAAAVFIADIKLPLGIAGGVPYVVPVALTLWFVNPLYTLLVAAGSAVLIVLDPILKPESQVPPYFVVINRAYALLAIGMVVGISHLRRKLIEQNAALAALGERERLSRELHDDLSQSVAAIGALASATSELLAQGRYRDAQVGLDRLRDAAGEAFLGLRQFITGLRVRPSEDHQFLSAVQDFARHFAERSGLGLQLDVPKDTEACQVTPLAEVQAIRIAQEALTNTTRHARARNLSIRVRPNGGFINIVFQDDGQGFDPSVVNPSDHLGLQIMRERAELAGGRLEVASSPGDGTSITLALPCQRRG